MIITLPFPFVSASQNGRQHYHRKAISTRCAKEMACRFGQNELVKNGKAKCKSRCEITYRFFVPDDRVRDEVNMIEAAKSYVDGLVRAGVIFRDDWQHLHTVGISVEVDKSNPRVELEIEECDS